MSIILMTSVAGSPGVTTAALGATLAWPQSAMLIDADHQQAVLAGFLRAQQPPTPSLAQLAFAAQRSNDLTDLLWESARPLPGDDSGQIRRRLFLPGPQTPWELATITQSWPQLAPSLRTFSRDVGVDLIIDLGRLQAPEQPVARIIPAALLHAATCTVVVVEPTLKHIAAARVMLEGLRDQVSHTLGDQALGLLVVRTPLIRDRDEARPKESFTNAEVAKAVGLPVLGELPHSARDALVLSHGQTPGRRWDKSPLAQSLRTVAGNLRQHCTRLEALQAGGAA